jgi:hypothetical protein
MSRPDARSPQIAYFQWVTRDTLRFSDLSHRGESISRPSVPSHQPESSRPTLKKVARAATLFGGGLRNSAVRSAPRAPDSVPVLPRLSEGAEGEGRTLSPVSRPAGDDSFFMHATTILWARRSPLVWTSL